MVDFITKDSGVREEFPGGSRRDSQENKPRYDLIGREGLLRLANLMARGAAKYSENNWRLGQPASRYYASMFRHMMMWAMGDRQEDHLAAVCFNAFGLMHIEDTLSKTRPELLDHESYTLSETRQALIDEFYDGPKPDCSTCNGDAGCCHEPNMETIKANLVKRGILGTDLLSRINPEYQLYCRECNQWHEIVTFKCDFFTRDDDWAE